MKATLLSRAGTWRDVADAARTTVGLTDGTGDPSVVWKHVILMAEHSPIRLLTFTVQLDDIPSWVSVHLTRHKVGVEHFVRTQRSDRTGILRDGLPQGMLVSHRLHINAQALIAISRKRLCRQAAPETRVVWELVVASLGEPLLQRVCVPECLYRGFCPEMKSCGFSETALFQQELKTYRQRELPI